MGARVTIKSYEHVHYADFRNYSVRQIQNRFKKSFLDESFFGLRDHKGDVIHFTKKLLSEATQITIEAIE